MNTPDIDAIAKGMVESVKAFVARAEATWTRKLEEVQRQLAAIPAARNGVDGAPGRDGASPDTLAVAAVVLEKLQPIVADLEEARISAKVAEAVAKIPAPKAGADGVDGAPGTPGTPGRDADPEAIVAIVLEKLPAPVPGPKGDVGERGEAGPQGGDGAPGPKGDAGDPGKAGERGEPGEIGPQGVAGKDGEPGVQGIQGEAGPQGVAGVDGKQGPEGTVGLAGPKGDVGPDGAAGKDGLPGPQGLVGPDGAPGAKGEIGPEGPAGTRGEIGPDGAAGPQGLIGPGGAPGVRGEIGPEGAPGKDGLAGAPGVRGEIGPEGPAGPKGDLGNPGLKGDRGDPGVRGEAGEAGRDAIAIDVLPSIDEAKSYRRGTYASYRGGLIKSVRQTEPITNGFDLIAAGWVVIVEGVAELSVVQSETDPRSFSVVSSLTSGLSLSAPFRMPVMVYQEIWTDREYERGDVVTLHGSAWYCRAEKTKEKPKPACQDWRLMVKEGRPGKDGRSFDDPAGPTAPPVVSLR